MMALLKALKERATFARERMGKRVEEEVFYSQKRVEY
jgi:hypothetical protein